MTDQNGPRCGCASRAECSGASDCDYYGAERKAIEAEYGKPAEQITEDDVQRKRAEHDRAKAAR